MVFDARSCASSEARTLENTLAKRSEVARLWLMPSSSTFLLLMSISWNLASIWKIDPAGKVMHAEVRIDDTVLMLADSSDGWPAHPVNVHIYVPDVDATYQRALAAGAESVQAPVKGDDPDKRGGVKDAGGTTWWIATQVG